MNDNKKDVEEMMSHLESNPASKDEEVEEETKVEEEEVEQEEVEETKAEGEGSSPEETEESETDEKDEVIDQLRGKIFELETGKAFTGTEEEKEKAVEEETKDETPEEKEEKVRQFVTTEEFDAIQTDPQKLNEVLQKVYQRAREDAYQASLKDIPDVISQTQARQQTMRQTIQEFYEENPDLSDYGKYIGYEANRLKAENPDKPIKEILDEAGQNVREELKIEKKAEEKERETREKEKDEQGQGPAFAKSGSGKRTGAKTDTRTDFDKQADAMLEGFHG